MNSNEVYDKQFISVDISIFSIIEGQLHVLLVKRGEEPFKGYWSLVGGKVYNYESCEEAVKRETKEKIGVESICPVLSGVFSQPRRDPRFRNISIAYYCIVSHNEFLAKINPSKVSDAEWIDMSKLPPLAFDHDKILQASLKNLQDKIYDFDFIKPFLPKAFTLVELQRIYENILSAKLDKRNFRRKITSLNVLKSTGEKNQADTHKKSEIFTFNN